MEYFYDHETDTLSLILADFAAYRSCEDVAPGLTLYCDAGSRPLAIEIRGARALVGVHGLNSFEAGTISSQDLSKRMSDSVHGRAVLRALSDI